MRSWNLGLGDPLSLTLAADARLGPTDYTNDQIWQLTLQGGEPPSVCFQTTYGLRAQWIRFFPRFVHKGVVVNDPAAFDHGPIIEANHPNYLRLSFWPVPGVEVRAEYWLPASQVAAGRLTFRNHHVVKEDLSFEWVGLLLPIGEGEGMSVETIENTLVLHGRSDDLNPVCLFNARPQAGEGPFPSLAFNLELLPGNTRQLTWALASFTGGMRSFQEASQALKRPWDAEIAGVELLNANQAVEISTGDEDWDAALSLTQKVAFGLFQSANQHLAHPSFVLSRLPDTGYSQRGDGSDFSYLWDGQTALDSYYLSSLILPGGVALAEGLLRNFLATQDEDGQIEWKPSLTGKTSKRMAQPVLASWACQIDEVKDDHSWLYEIYPALLKFFKAWLSPAHDRDQDGFPEWDHPLQTGLEDNPLYDRWQAASEGLEIQSLECPSLASLLFGEAVSLAKIASAVGAEQDVPWLQETAARLRTLVEECWRPARNIYHCRDFATHQSGRGGKVASLQGSGVKTVGRSYKVLQRIALHLARHNETTRAITVRVSGTTPEGKVTEEFSPRRWAWLNGHGSASSQNAFLRISRIEVEGAEEGDVLTVSRPDFLLEDIGDLLPLWAGIPSLKRAGMLVNNCLVPRFLKSYGVADYLPKENQTLESSLQRVSPLWNYFVGEGLINYGYRAQAGELVTRLMEAVLPALRENFAFRQQHDPETGHPKGQRNHLRGLPPLALFLHAAGIRAIGSDFVILHDFNVFPWPVTVKYHGMVVTCIADRTDVTFPNGETIKITSPGIHRVALV